MTFFLYFPLYGKISKAQRREGVKYYGQAGHMATSVTSVSVEIFNLDR
ncbi:hypothetical protein XBFFR1_1490100 [Xenorhabdus bovienii str. feltiae France]|nr:hypothetical protein XBFFR1_1490100 [Xenorhabdus bovienii str. feltiae France]